MRKLLLVVVIVGLLASPAIARQWSSRNGGFSVEAELLDVKDGNAILQKTDGSQVSVPLNKLSLGDIRYINDVLKSAEDGITGSKPADRPTEKKLEPASKPDSPPIAPEVLKKLHYQWKKDQTWSYRVKITGERGYYSEYYAGNVTYSVRSIEDNETTIAMNAYLTRGERAQPVEMIIVGGPAFGPPALPGRHVRVHSSIPRDTSVSVVVDPLGRVDHIEGEWQLPYLVGDLSQLMIEQLPDSPQPSWIISSDTGLSVVTTYYPYYRFWGMKFREGIQATEKTTYTVQSEKDNLITLAKHYELTTPAEVAGKPRYEVAGDGKLVFDTQRCLPDSLDFRENVTVRDGTKTEEVPVRITYHLVDEAEMAKAAKEAEEAALERKRPLNDKDVENALADLTSGDATRIQKSTKLLSEKKPPQPNAKVARALEEILAGNDNALVRGDAATALKTWSTPESVPILITAMLNDSWPPVHSAAIEALIQYKPKSAIEPIAHQLSDLHSRRAAAKALKTYGVDAEDAVLPYLTSVENFQLHEIIELIQAIGTEKSIPTLQKLADSKEPLNMLTSKDAQKAIDAIKLRQRMQPTDK